MTRKPKTYKGIEYVQLSELPEDERVLLSQTFNREFIIKIQVNGKIVNDCIQFKDYSMWYEQQFKRSTSFEGVESQKGEDKDLHPKHAIEFEVQKL